MSIWIVRPSTASSCQRPLHSVPPKAPWAKDFRGTVAWSSHNQAQSQSVAVCRLNRANKQTDRQTYIPTQQEGTRPTNQASKAYRCMHACMHTCILTCTLTYTHIRTYIHTFIHSFIQKFIFGPGQSTICSRRVVTAPEPKARTSSAPKKTPPPPPPHQQAHQASRPHHSHSHDGSLNDQPRTTTTTTAAMAAKNSTTTTTTTTAKTRTCC